MSEPLVYLDNAATTPVSQTVLRAMLPYYTEDFGNPSSLYSLGRRARKALEAARETVADCLGARPDEIFFTSGGSESDNWALKGTAHSPESKGKRHIVTTAMEHHAILHPCRSLEREGFEITYLSPKPNGIVDPDELKAALRPDTALVSVMMANNEIGTLQPIERIGEICRQNGTLFHTDAVQAAGILPVDAKAQSFDLLSLSAHKFHGPKGTGALYVRKGTDLASLIDGGAQERSRRAGTENVAGAVGLAAALREACEGMEQNAVRMTKLRDRLIDGILKISGTELNGDAKKRLPGNVNVSIEGVEGESLILLLDQKGICASSGSACAAGSVDPSHVLTAIGLPPKLAQGSLRLTLGTQNTDSDVDAVLAALPEIVAKIRTLSKN